MLFLVATNVVASRPPERRPTGTPLARANIQLTESRDYRSVGKYIPSEFTGPPSVFISSLTIKYTEVMYAYEARDKKKTRKLISLKLLQAWVCTFYGKSWTDFLTLFLKCAMCMHEVRIQLSNSVHSAEIFRNCIFNPIWTTSYHATPGHTTSHIFRNKRFQQAGAELCQAPLIFR